MKDEITVKHVKTLRQKYQFASLPHLIYKKEPAFTPPLILERMFRFSQKRNPYFKHAKVALFLAYKNKKPVGRISAQICQLFLQKYDNRIGHFGFIDAINEQAVFDALLLNAKRWLKQNGMTRMEGPYSFSTNDECGLLIEGHEKKQTFMYPYHPKYVQERLENTGLRKIKDLFSYDFNPKRYYEFRKDNPRFANLIKRYLDNKQKIGNVNSFYVKNDAIKRFDDVTRFYNEAWKHNWRFLILTPQEKKVFYNLLKLIKHYSYLAFVENKEQEILSLIYFIPAINGWIDDMEGKLFPFNIFKLIYRIFFSTPKAYRAIIAGVSEKFHGKQEAAFIFASAIEACYNEPNDGVSKLIHSCCREEDFIINAGWILEDNSGMNSIMEKFLLAERSHVFRLYEGTLDTD